MSDTNTETIADIIAEMRRGTRLPGFWRSCDLNKILQYHADRLEAAHKRERGDCAKLREAVIGLRDRISMFYKNEWIPYDEWEGANDDAKVALAAPPRNCDVGTAEEQDERFHRFCVMQRKGSCAGCPDPVGGRTVANGIRECALVWAQMPYEEGGAK